MTEQVIRLLEMINRAQLVLFGRFVHNAQVLPFSLLFDMLPSYPEILREAAEHICATPIASERLVCDSDSLPLATAVSLHTGIPLVYSRNAIAAPLELVGAYDIGHPATLILNSLQPGTSQGFILSAQKVGLNIRETRSFCGIRTPTAGESCIFQLESYVSYLAQEKKLPAGQARSVLVYLRQ